LAAKKPSYQPCSPSGAIQHGARSQNMTYFRLQFLIGPSITMLYPVLVYISAHVPQCYFVVHNISITSRISRTKISGPKSGLLILKIQILKNRNFA
jgi:hypothetical protein